MRLRTADPATSTSDSSPKAIEAYRAVADHLEDYPDGSSFDLRAAIGAACNTLKESQNLLTPVMLLLMLPMIFQRYIVQHPQDPWVIAMSLFPPLTPLVMLVRIAVDPALGILEIIASMLVLGAAVPVVIWAAAKIFRTGILMYGKTPSPREILRWLR